MKTAAIIIPVYNMAAEADALVKFIKDNVNETYDFYVIDNGSYMERPASATHRIENNCGCGGGLWYGIDRAREAGGYKYYWLLSTSTRFDADNIHGDPLALLLRHFDRDPNCIAVQPGWKGAKVWTHKMQSWKPECYQTPIMNTALWNAAWWDAVDGFDRRLTYGCGSGMELRHKKQDWMTYWVCSEVPLILEEGVIYHRRRAPITRQEYIDAANRQMCEVLTDKYGENWMDILLAGIDHPAWDPCHA